MKVYCLFRALGDGDSYTRFELLDVYGCLRDAKNTAKILFEAARLLPDNIAFVHSSMTIENFGTYIGSRNDCELDCCCGYYEFGGYVIEERNII